jgi:hypothetical protein
MVASKISNGWCSSFTANEKWIVYVHNDYYEMPLIVVCDLNLNLVSEIRIAWLKLLSLDKSDRLFTRNDLKKNLIEVFQLDSAGKLTRPALFEIDMFELGNVCADSFFLNRFVACLVSKQENFTSYLRVTDWSSRKVAFQIKVKLYGFECKFCEVNQLEKSQPVIYCSKNKLGFRSMVVLSDKFFT